MATLGKALGTFPSSGSCIGVAMTPGFLVEG